MFYENADVQGTVMYHYLIIAFYVFIPSNQIFESKFYYSKYLSYTALLRLPKEWSYSDKVFNSINAIWTPVMHVHIVHCTIMMI
jgi:hypothetical protein